MQLGAGVLIGVLMQVYSAGFGRLPRRWVIPVTQAGEVALLVLFWFLFRTGAEWVSVAFYVLGMILGILLISQFWTLANDIYDARQAKRLFGFIGGGASLGGAAGLGDHGVRRRRGRDQQSAAGERGDAGVCASCWSRPSCGGAAVTSDLALGRRGAGRRGRRSDPLARARRASFR